MATVRIKRGDVGVVFNDTLTADGPAVNLTGGSVLFLLRNNETGTVVSQTATLVTPASGVVRYTSIAADLSTVGQYRQEWQAILAGGQIYTFPSDGWNEVV